MSTSNYGGKDQNLYHQQQKYPTPSFPLTLQQSQKNPIHLIPYQISNINHQQVISVNYYLATRDRLEHH